jgi:4,5-dihydroxyphthalate decarboxylase
VKKPSDLNGRKVGVPEWAETALVYARGMLADDYGVDLRSITWFQGGVNQPGRTEKVKLALPDGLNVTPVPSRSLNDMLLRGEIDAIMGAWPPDAFTAGDKGVKRLFDDVVAVEQRYFAATKIFPIMHVVAIRREILDRDPWIAANLYAAFIEAKRRSVVRALSVSASTFPIPWWYVHAAQAQKDFGGELWPYGVDANRVTLQPFLKWAFEQGVCHKLLTPEEIFPASVQSSSRL